MDTTGMRVAEEPVFDDSSITAARRRIRRALAYSLEKKYNVTDPAIVDKFMGVHGLSDKHFDFLSNFESLVEDGAANNSIDTNANKSETSIAGLLNEISLPINKTVGYRALYRQMKDLYGKKRAKELSGEMYDMSLALADSTNILKPYCYSINAQKLVMEGRDYGPAPSQPPKRVQSYVNALCEIIHALSNSLAGAIAIGSFFLDVTHVMLFREGKTYKDLQDPQYRKYIENCLQSFVHSVNSLSRNATESPFTNISIFDRVKLGSMIDDMSWYFDFYELSESLQKEITWELGGDVSEKDWRDYVIKTICDIQEIYMEVMDRGVVAHNNRPFTFPVSTVNLSRYEKADGSFGVEDEEFLQNFCKKHDIYRYNIYCSEGTKVASCCRLVNDVELLDLASSVNSFGGTSLSLGSHRVCTINLRRVSLECTSWENFIEILKKRCDSASDILYAHRKLIEDLISKGTQPFLAGDDPWVSLSRMFSTWGILGYCEAVEDLEKRFGKDRDYLKEILEVISDYALETTKKRGFPVNIEEIPGESMGWRLAFADRYLYGEEKVPELMYSNQFLPNYTEEGAKATLKEKLAKESYVKYLTGGGIAHLNLGERLTSKQAERVIAMALEAGLEHFACNCNYAICEDNHWNFGRLQTCPTCGKPIIDNFTRTVGFFVRTSNMNKIKREVDFEGRNYQMAHDAFRD